MGLVTRSLQLDRGGRRLFQNLELSFASGQVCVVLGPNGSGKSSLLLTLAGEVAPSAGQVLLDGRPMTRVSPRRRAEAIAWQGDLPSADFGFTVAERLAVAPSQKRSPLEALERLDLDGLEDRRLGALSSGERQRVELAALWLRAAPVWLLDEPTAHLDLRHQVRWLEILHEEAADGRTIIVVLHDLSQAHAIADHAVALFGDGRVERGNASTLFQPEVLERLYGVGVQRLRGEAAVELLPVYPNRLSTRGCDE